MGKTKTVKDLKQFYEDKKSIEEKIISIVNCLRLSDIDLLFDWGIKTVDGEDRIFCSFYDFYKGNIELMGYDFPAKYFEMQKHEYIKDAEERRKQLNLLRRKGLSK